MMVTRDTAQRFTPPPVNVVDSTAAGDSFTAAMVSLYNGQNLPESLQFANRVASLVCTRPGAQDSIPTAEEISAMMQENT